MGSIVGLEDGKGDGVRVIKLGLSVGIPLGECVGSDFGVKLFKWDGLSEGLTVGLLDVELVDIK